MKKKLFMLSLALISCVCVLSGVAACSTDEQGNVTDVHIHDVPLTYYEAVEATCTTAGNVAYYTCESCGKYFQDYSATVELSESQVFIAALGHDYTTTFTWAEDYSTATATRVCSHDASHTETVTAVITSETTDATCAADGSVKYTATATFSDNETATDEKSTTIPATGEHVYSTDWSYNSSYHWQECTICGNVADRAEHSYEITDDKAQCTVCGYVANEALGLDAEKSLTLVDGEANESGYATAASYLYYNAVSAGTYELTLTFDNSMVPYFVDIVVSVNGTVVTGDGYEYIVDLAEGMNYVEISYTGTGATIVLSDYTYTAALSAYVAPVTNDLAMGANTVEEYTTYTFKADSDGYYTFTVSETSGWAAIYSSEDSWSALLDEYGKGQTSYTTQISAGSSITLYFTNASEGNFVVTVTYSATNPDPNAVTTDVPATLAIGDNAIALSEEDGATGVAATFTATDAGIYSFSISGDNSAYASLGKKYTVSDRSLQVVKSNDPQTYTLEANQTITIYFYSADDAKFTFNIVFGDTVSTDDDYLLSKTYTITTERDADYGDYRFKKTYIIKTSGTYTFTLDTTATTGTSTLYISNDGTLWDLAASLSVDGTTTATYELTEGNSVIFILWGDTTETTYVLTVSNSNDEPAHEHSYEAAWSWSADYSSATVTFTCTSGDDTQTVTATVSSVSKAATCTADGLTTYTAKATFNGVEYTDTKTETIPATGHTYGEAVWTWAADYSTATVAFTCTSNDDTKTVEATITVSTNAATCTADGLTTYTATATFDGVEYTDVKTETIPATGHTYGDPVWSWNGYTEATATFTCSACSDEQIVTATITSETTAATCTVDGSTVYTATVTFDSNTYTDTNTETIAATGHSYTAAWTWADDYSSADLTLTCGTCGNVQSLSADSSSTTGANGETAYTVTYTYEGVTYTDSKTVYYILADTYTLETTYDEDRDDYRLSKEFIVKETGTYTFKLDTTATTGTQTIYLSLDGTLFNLAAELSVSGTTSSVSDLTAGDTVTAIVYGDASATAYVINVSYIDLCSHDFTDAWVWADNYASADLTLTCSKCGMVITATAVESTSTTDSDGNTVYTVSYTYNGLTYSESKTVEAGDSKTFNGTIYNMSSLSSTYSTSSGIGIPVTLFDGFVTTYTSGTATSLTYRNEASSIGTTVTVVDGQTLYNGVDLSYCIGMTKYDRGLQFVLSENATFVMYYSNTNSNSYLTITDANNPSNVIEIKPATVSGNGSAVYCYTCELPKGTYIIANSATNTYSGSAYVFAIGASGNATVVSGGGSTENTNLTLENGYTWDSEVGTTGAYVYIATDYELTGGTTYTLTVKDSGVYTLTTGNSDVTFGTTTIGANTSVTLDLYAGEEYAVIAVSDVTLTAQFVEVTGYASGAYDTTLAESDPDNAYTFASYTGSVSLAAGEVAYYRIDAATQDGDGNTTFNMYIYVDGDVDNVSVYFSKTQDEANIAAKDSYELVSLDNGYYYVTISARGHGYFKIVANSAATITVELNEGGNGGTDDDDSGSGSELVLGETTTLDFSSTDDQIFSFTYNATSAGSYKLTLSGDHAWWTTGLAMMTGSVTVTVNGTKVSSSTGIYTLSLVEGENTIVIDYSKLGSAMVTGYTYTATLNAA